jgi:N-methylhydantoinase A
MLVADLRADFSQTFLADLTNGDVSEAIATEVGRLAGQLASRGQAGIAEALATFGSGHAPHLRAALDLRYKGQNYEITVPLRAGRDLAAEPGKVLAEAVEDFHTMHERVYGYASRDAVIQFVTLRVGVGVEQDRTALIEAEARRPTASTPPGERPIRLVEAPGTPTVGTVWQRSVLTSGMAVRGPAIVEQMDTTILVLPGQTATTDTWGNLLIAETER